MERRDVVKRIGTAGLLVGVGAGAASARTGDGQQVVLTEEELADRDDLDPVDHDACHIPPDEPCTIGECPSYCDFCIC